MVSIGGRSIFVVDDEEAIAYTLGQILRRSGYGAVSFTDPMEALEEARLQAPDLLISDVSMPGLSGIDLAIRVRSFLPKCSILLISAHATVQDFLDKVPMLDNFRLLAKPIHPSDLLRELEQLPVIRQEEPAGVREMTPNI